MDLLKKKLSGKSGGDILDVATQAGDFIIQLKEAFKDYNKAVGIDISDKDFKKARETFKDDPVEFIIMDGANLEFDEATFDTVGVCAGLHHMDNISGVLSEMKRALKPGRLFVLREMFRDNQNEKQITDVMQHDWYAKISRLLGKKHNPSLTKQAIIDYVESLGLKRLEMAEGKCDKCPRSLGQTVEKEIAEMDEDLEKVKGYPQYDELKIDRDKIVERIKTIGIACASHLDIIGIK